MTKTMKNSRKIENWAEKTGKWVDEIDCGARIANPREQIANLRELIANIHRQKRWDFWDYGDNWAGIANPWERIANIHRQKRGDFWDYGDNWAGIANPCERKKIKVPGLQIFASGLKNNKIINVEPLSGFRVKLSFLPLISSGVIHIKPLRGF
jgi:hypothetical protein